MYVQSQQNYCLYSFADYENKYYLRELIQIVINQCATYAVVKISA